MLVLSYIYCYAASILETGQRVAEAILHGNIDFKREPWPHVSDYSKDLVGQMLQTDPKTRLQVKKVLAHLVLREGREVGPFRGLGGENRSAAPPLRLRPRRSASAPAAPPPPRLRPRRRRAPTFSLTRGRARSTPLVERPDLDADLRAAKNSRLTFLTRWGDSSSLEDAVDRGQRRAKRPSSEGDHPLARTRSGPRGRFGHPSGSGGSSTSGGASDGRWIQSGQRVSFRVRRLSSILAALRSSQSAMEIGRQEPYLQRKVLLVESKISNAIIFGSVQKEDEPVKKRKQSQVALVLEEYMDFRKKQTQVLVDELKEPKETDKYSLANCVAALEPMEELSLAEKSKALRLFKCGLNRETFLNIKDPTLRIFWLKEEIADMQKN